MSDMPERIWAQYEESTDWGSPEWWQPEPIGDEPCTEYIRVDALVARLKAAFQVVRKLDEARERIAELERDEARHRQGLASFSGELDVAIALADQRGRKLDEARERIAELEKDRDAHSAVADLYDAERIKNHHLLADRDRLQAEVERLKHDLERAIANHAADLS